MDEIELLVAETFKHFHENFEYSPDEEFNSEISQDDNANTLLPDSPGIIYHVQKSVSVFVIRTFVSKNIHQDYLSIVNKPEDYPSLRLIDGDVDLIEKLKFFIVDNSSEAEIIHDQLNNRRFPIHEEMMCNLSDPGFSWWLTKKDFGFQISFTMSVTTDDRTLKLGPMGDKELALRRFQSLEHLVSNAGLELNIQNELNRVQFTDCEEFLLEELKDLFEFGVITDTMKDIFKILSIKTKDHSLLEEIWFYLHELASMRRFWIQVQYNLNN